MIEETIRYEPLDKEEERLVDKDMLRTAMSKYVRRTGLKAMLFVRAVLKYRKDGSAKIKDEEWN